VGIFGPLAHVNKVVLNVLFPTKRTNAEANSGLAETVFERLERQAKEKFEDDIREAEESKWEGMSERGRDIGRNG